MAEGASIRGRWGESLASDYLQQLGYKILKKNYKRCGGEVDIIARDGEDIVFVEVKTWLHTPYVDLGTAISAAKQKRIQRTAVLYLQDNPEFDGCSMRFDVVLIGADSGIDHLRDSF